MGTVMEPENKDKKLEELVVYISSKCKDHSLFGSIKLNKILFFADFFSFQTKGKSISGTDYSKLDFGPAPRRMKPILRKLEGNESITLWSRAVLAGGALRNQRRPLARREPDLTIFDGADIALVDKVIGLLEHMSANEVSTMTHEHLGWKLAEPGETIPYFTAFIGTGTAALSSRDVEAGQKVLASIA